MSDWKTIVGLEVHAELQTQSKMFSACPVVDSGARCMLQVKKITRFTGN
jgi:Asp-tRNA(Asn)/Glu-tRNA(Gln) amidotransferase B subunit